MNWNEYFMALALTTALKSNDKSTQTGAVIARSDFLLGAGFNGPPRYLNPSLGDIPESGPEKYAYIIHAEVNAILNAKPADLGGATIYANHFPCADCVKMAAQVGVSRIVYYHKDLLPRDGYHYDLAVKLAEMGGIRLQQQEPTRELNVLSDLLRTRGKTNISGTL